MSTHSLHDHPLRRSLSARTLLTNLLLLTFVGVFAASVGWTCTLIYAVRIGRMSADILWPLGASAVVLGVLSVVGAGCCSRRR